MASQTVQTVIELKKSLAKELAKDNSNENDSDKCLDLLKRLDEVSVNIKILTETLVGAVVSKFKSNSHQEVASTAKALVKKWKRQAKQENNAASSSSSSSPKPSTSKSTPSKKKPSAARSTRAAPAAAAAPPPVDSAEWSHLPPHRKKMAAKFHEIFSGSEASLLQTGLSSEALSPLCISRATEVEEAINLHSKGNASTYSTKVRALIFNMKKNADLREKLILGFTTVKSLVNMTPAELATAEENKKRTDTIQKLQDSMRLDWDDANENKINEQCGITGDLLKASLFTCGRCKSIKTTSTQKQTRSADEPMTVFVFCLNCGKRWKC